MASGDNRHGRDNRTGYTQPNSHQDPSDPSERYRSQQQQPTMSAAVQSSQFANPSNYAPYSYFNQNAPGTMQQSNPGYGSHVPRSPLPPPLGQPIPASMYGMAQSAASQQFGVYAPITGPLPQPVGMVATTTYYAHTGMGQQGSNAGMVQQDQSQYYAQPTYTPLSQSMPHPSFQPHGNPSFSPQSNPSDPGSTSSQLSPLLASYNRMIRHTLECLRADRLPEAAVGLLQMSYELLQNVERYDLVFDDVTKRTGRLRLWHNFNNTWLAVLTKQKDVSDEILKAMVSGTSTAAPQIVLISTQTLQRLGDELIPLCNGVDEWGLVDYEMGVWEEQIIDILDPCREVSVDIDRVRSGRPPRSRRRISATARTTDESTTQTSAGRRATASPLPSTAGGQRR